MMPERLFFVGGAKAVLDGRDLGHPVTLEANPTIGAVPLPTRPTFVIGQAHARIRDAAEYRETRRRLVERGALGPGRWRAGAAG